MPEIDKRKTQLLQTAREALLKPDFDEIEPLLAAWPNDVAAMEQRRDAVLIRTASHPFVEHCFEFRSVADAKKFLIIGSEISHLLGDPIVTVED